ncbi:hypothetical protein JOM56_002834 [Amanita muscaria]
MAKTEDNLKALKEEKEKTYEFETKITIQTEEIKRLQAILEKHDQLLQDKTAKPSSARHAADALSLANSNWIWTDSGYMTVNPFVTADFRRDLSSPAGKTAVSSQIIITADNIYTLYVNGESIGYGNDWTLSQQYCVKLDPGYNVFAVAVENEENGPDDTTPNPAAFIAAIQINYSDGTSGTIVTDSQWLGNVATPGFQSIRYNDAGWKNAFVAGHVNSFPWRTPTGPNGPSSLSIAGSYWVWTNEVPPNNPMSVAPIGSRAFRKTIDVAGGATVRTGTIIIDADDEYDLYINGNYIGSGSNWQTAQCWKFTLDYPTGDIVFAVNATNTGDQAGIIAAIALDVFDCSCSTTLFDITDGSWKYDLAVPPGFQQPDYNDASWPNVVVAGPYGVHPWGWVPTQNAN